MNDSPASSAGWVDADRRAAGPPWSDWLTVGASMAALAVVLGAMAAHGIDHYLAEQYQSSDPRKVAGHSVPAAQKYLDDFKTASRYQMYHALGLMLIGVVATFRPSRLLNAAAWCQLLGIVLFCGSLYLLALAAHALEPSARHGLGLAAATGGTLFIVGWCLFAAAVCPCRTHGASSSSR